MLVTHIFLEGTRTHVPSCEPAALYLGAFIDAHVSALQLPTYTYLRTPPSVITYTSGWITTVRTMPLGFSIGRYLTADMFSSLVNLRSS